MKKTLFGLAVVLLSGAATPGAATMWLWSATLDGLQEVPPNASPGTGSINGTLDDVTGSVVVTFGVFANLTAPAVAAHIHGLAPPGTNAGVLIPLTATNATSGTLTGSGVLSAPNVTGMLAGLTYANVHTNNFPGGEIRGQISVQPIPEPASILAVTAGLGLAALRRRKSR